MCTGYTMYPGIIFEYCQVEFIKFIEEKIEQKY